MSLPSKFKDQPLISAARIVFWTGFLFKHWGIGVSVVFGKILAEIEEFWRYGQGRNCLLNKQLKSQVSRFFGCASFTVQICFG